MLPAACLWGEEGSPLLPAACLWGEEGAPLLPAASLPLGGGRGCPCCLLPPPRFCPNPSTNSPLRLLLSDFKGIYQECAQVLYQEIDYINEGRNR